MNFKYYLTIGILTLFLFPNKIHAQALNFTAVRAGVNFDRPLRKWDGFGVNYVQTAHFINRELSKDVQDEWWKKNHPGKESIEQEYGGFSILDEKERQEIVELVFGDNGLKPGIVKMFLGAKHQAEPGGPFDHKTTTSQMRYFVKQGLELTRKRGDDLQIITTLYGPPGFMTLQKVNRARDLDPAYKDDLAMYMIDWVKFLIQDEGLPVKYLSLHNEGEDWHRWNEEGYTTWYKNDFNLYWPPEQINEFVKLMPVLLKQNGLEEVGITPGEPSNWYRYSGWGLADFLANDHEAVQSMALLTSHGFYRGVYGPWFGEHNSYTIDLLHKQRPELHSWVTSTSWADMDASFVKQIHGNIYTSKVNAIIPWAAIQRPSHWIGGDPNPGSAIQVNEDGSYEIRKGYYFYKQVTRAGQPGMKVVSTFAMDSEIAVIGFSGNGTKNPDSFVVINISDSIKPLSLEIHGSGHNEFEAFRTTDNEKFEKERFASIGTYKVEEGSIFLEALPGSVTTFFGK